MLRFTLTISAFFWMAFAVPPCQAAKVTFWDWAFNADGALAQHSQGDPMPGTFNDAAFDYATGSGTIIHTFSLSGTGSHALIGFYDFEIEEGQNTFFNEYGSVAGSTLSGQSWEIGEPGYTTGNIYSKVLGGSLDNTNGVPSGAPDDVSMAMGWNFVLGDLQTALVSFFVSDTAPDSGFFISQHDPDSNASLYLSSTLEVSGGPEPIPLPGTIFLFGTGLAGLIAAQRLRNSRNS